MFFFFFHVFCTVYRRSGSNVADSRRRHHTVRSPPRSCPETVPGDLHPVPVRPVHWLEMNRLPRRISADFVWDMGYGIEYGTWDMGWSMGHGIEYGIFLHAFPPPSIPFVDVYRLCSWNLLIIWNNVHFWEKIYFGKLSMPEDDHRLIQDPKMSLAGYAGAIRGKKIRLITNGSFRVSSLWGAIKKLRQPGGGKRLTL